MASLGGEIIMDIKEIAIPDATEDFEKFVAWARGYILIEIGRGDYRDAVWRVCRYLQVQEEEKRKKAPK